MCNIIISIKQLFSFIGLAEWYEPTGGMFLWLKIIGLNDTKPLVTSRCLKKLVVLAPGYAFATNYTNSSPYVRISYSIATQEEIDRVCISF
jgi:kynurenine/2-aminoadipate aminotransferase